MKKVKVLMVKCLIITSTLLLFTGCDKNGLHMDADKCAEAALEYLEGKYQTDFEVLDSGEKYKYIGTAGYAEVIVKTKMGNEEDRYVVTVYPDGTSDADKDGYYDSYKVVSDTYMCYLLQDYAKNEMDKLLMEAGLTRFISNVGIREYGGIAGFSGFAADFPVQNEESFSLDNVLDYHEISIDCWLKIPESEKNDKLQSNITNIMKPLVSADDLIAINIEVYDDVTYNEIKNNIDYSGRGKEKIYFYVEEDEDESK